MANMDKNEPKGYGYGNSAKLAGNPAPEMKSNGSVKNRIPDAMTNKVGKDAGPVTRVTFQFQSLLALDPDLMQERCIRCELDLR